jgi:cob(I)alamin adenosyltransferase
MERAVRRTADFSLSAPGDLQHPPISEPRRPLTPALSPHKGRGRDPRQREGEGAPTPRGGEGEPDEAEINHRHNEKMARRKAARDRMLATKTEERGLLIVHTGKGKGKSTAAFGLVLRCLGHGMRVGIVQFVKGVWRTGERAALERFGDLVTCRAMGEGFTWETQDRARDIAAARRAWETAKAMIADASYRLVLLDELNIVLRYDYLPLDEVVAALRAKPHGQHVVVTGRNAKPELIEAADCVTEFALVKHHFAAGVRAQEAIEF